MRIFKTLLCAIFLISNITPAYAEVMFDKPVYQPNAVRPSFRSPQEIIADFQASVDKIQEEQQGLYGEIESKNKENAFLLRKINDLSIKLLQLDYSLSKKSSQSGQEESQQVVKLTEEKDVLLKKYNEALSQKLSLESEIQKLNSDQKSVEDKVQAGVATLREALNSSQEEIAQLKAQMQVLLQEKENLEQERRQAFEDKSVLQSRIQSMEVQIQEMKDNSAETAAARKNPLQQRVRELSDRADQMLGSLREKDQALTAAKKREAVSLADLKKIQKENDDLKKQFERLTSTYNTAQEGRAAKITRLESLIQEKQKEIDRLSKQGAVKQKETPAFDSERNALNKQIVRLKEDQRKGQAEFDRKLEKANAPYLLQIEALQKTLDDKNVDLQTKNKEIISLNSKTNALSKELDDIRKQKNSLKQSVQTLQEKTGKEKKVAGNSKTSLQEEIVFLKTEIVKRDEQLKERSKRLDELEAQKKELSSVVEAANREKESLQATIASYKGQLTGDQAETENKAEDVRKEYEQKMSFLSAEIKALEEKLNVKEKEIEDRDQQKQSLQAAVESLKVELDRAKTVAQPAVAVKDRQNDNAVSALKNKLKERQSEIEKLKVDQQRSAKELKKTAEERRQIEKQLTALKLKFDQQETSMAGKMRQARAPLEEAIAKLNKQLDEQTELVDDKEQLLADLRVQNQTWEEALKKGSDEREELKRKISDLQSSLEAARTTPPKTDIENLPVDENAQSAADKELEEANKALKNRDAQIEELKIKNQELDQRLAAVEKEKSQAQESIKELNVQLEVLKNIPQETTLDVNARWKKEIEDLQESTSDSKQALKIQKALVSTLNAKIADQSIEIRRLTEEGVQLRSSLAGTKDDKSRLEKELKIAQDKLSQKVKEPFNDSQDSQKDLDAVTKERNEILTKLDQMTQDRDTLKKQLEEQSSRSLQKEKDFQDNSKAAYQKYEDEIIALKDQKNKLNQQLSDAFAREATTQRTTADLNGQLEEMRKNRLILTDGTKADWQAKIDSLEADLKKAKDQSSNAEGLIKDLQQKNAELNSLLESSQRSLAEKDKTIVELGTAQKGFLVKSGSFDKERENFELKIKTLTQEIASLQTSQFSEVTSVKSESAQKVADLARKLADAVGETRSKEELIGQMSTRQTSLEQQLSEALLAKSRAETAATQAKSELEGARKEFETEKNQMKEDVQRFGHERDDQVIKVNELQNALKDAQNQTKIALNEAREPLIKEIEGLKGQLKEKESQIKRIEATNKEWNQTKEDLIRQLAASQLKQKDIQAKFDEWKNAISSKEVQNRGAAVNVERELTEKINSITAQLNESKQQSDDLIKSKNELEEKLKEQQAQTAALEAELSQKNQMLLTDKSKTSEEFLTKQAALEAQIKELTSQTVDAKRTIDELTKSKIALEDGLKTKETQAAQLQASSLDKVKTAEALNEQMAQELLAVKTTSQEQIQQLTQDLNEARQSLETVGKSKAALEEKLAANEAVLKELQSGTSQKEQAIAEVKTKAAEDLSALKKESQDQVQQLTKDLNEARQSIAELEKSKMQMQGELDAKASMLKDLQAGTSQKDQTITEIKIKAGEELSRLKKDSQEQIQKLTQDLNAAGASMEVLERSKTELEEKLALKESALKELQAASSQKDQAITEVRSRSAEELSVFKKESQDQIGELTDKIKEAQSMIDSLQRAKEVLEKDLQAKETTTVQLETKIAETQKTLAQAKEQSAQELAAIKNNSDAALDELTQQLKSSNEDRAVLSKSKEGLEVSLKAAEEKIAQLSKDMADQANQWQKKVSEQERSAKTLAEEARAPLMQEIDGFKAKISDNAAQIESLTAQNKELIQAREQLTRQLDEVQAREKENQIKMAGVQEAMINKSAQDRQALISLEKDLKDRIEEITAELNTSQMRAAELSKAKDALEQDLKTKQTTIAQLEVEAIEKTNALTLAGSKTKEEIAAVRKTAQEEAAKLNTKIKDYERIILDLTHSKETLEEDLKSKEAQIVRLQGEASDRQEELAALKTQSSDQLTEIQDQLNAKIQQLTDELKSGQSELSDLIKTKEGLEAALKASQQGLAEAKAEIANKEATIKTVQADIPAQIAAAKKPLEDKIDILVKSLGDAQADVKTKQVTLEGLNAKVSGLEKTLSETSAAKAGFEKASQEAKAALDKTLKEMTAAIQKANKPLLEKNQLLQAAADEKDKKITALTAERDRLSAELSELTADRQKLQQEAALLKQEIDNQKRALNDKEAAVKQPLLLEIAELQKTLAEKDQLIEQKAEAFTKVNGELATVLKGLAVIREERDKMSATVKPLEAQVKAIPQEVALAKAPLEQENARLNIELDKVRSMLDLRVKGLESDLTQKTTDYEEAISSRQAMEKEIDRVSKANEELSQDMEKLQLKLSKKFQEDCGVALEEIQKPWKDKIDQLKSQLDGRDKEIESFKNENLRLNEELGSVSNPASSSR